MADVALTPNTFVSETLETASTGLIPAAVGAAGAGLGLIALTSFLAPASVPMSLIGLVLARRSRNWAALALGTLGLVLAAKALVATDSFWVVFAALVSGMGVL